MDVLQKAESQEELPALTGRQNSVANIQSSLIASEFSHRSPLLPTSHRRGTEVNMIDKHLDIKPRVSLTKKVKVEPMEPDMTRDYREQYESLLTSVAETARDESK